jgi:hypothetical protein
MTTRPAPAIVRDPSRIDQETTTMFDCGHRCCEMRDNRYHVHADEPEGCGRCAAADDVPGIVATVIDAILPHLPPRSDGAPLAALVHAVVLSVCGEAHDDPQVRMLDRAGRRRVLAARAGLVLTFPI